MKDIKGDDAAKWASKLFDTGFVKEAVTNDNVTSTVSTFVSDITQELFGGDDDD